MSKYFWMDTRDGKYKTLYWRHHPMGSRWKQVYLDEDYCGQIFGDDGGWGAIVAPSDKQRGPSLGQFRTRFAATQYLLWAQGIAVEDHKPFS